MRKNDSCRLKQEAAEAAGQRHGQIHGQIEEHFHSQYHGHICGHDLSEHVGETHSQHLNHGHHTRHYGQKHNSILTIRSHSGISGDMLLTGLAILNLGNIAPDSSEGLEWLEKLCASIMPELGHCLSLQHHSVGGIRGWQAKVSLPPAHEHRCLADIKNIIANADICEEAKKRATSCFELLADCEAYAHGTGVDDVHFHEVGALDSILDICGVCELYERLKRPKLICGPLPIADGLVKCAHGILPAPAPAVLRLLKGLPVRPFGGDAQAGELLTPTGIALLRALDTSFGPWPAFRIASTVLVYGQKAFSDAPNGVIFALGK